jgi:hypothetical protein
LPASSAFGDCMEKESSDSMVGNFEVARATLSTAVDSSLASQPWNSDSAALSLKAPIV